MAFQFPINPIVGQQFAPIVDHTYEWNGTGWILIGQTVASMVPAGVIMSYAGYAPPVTAIPFQGWLMCDGTVYPIASYPVLFAVISNTFGGNGTTTFAVPDLRGRVIAGVDNMGTAGFASRLTAASLGTSGTINAQGGSESISLSTSQLPSHTHGISDVAHSHGVSDPTHAHSISDPGHAHTIADPGHTHAGYVGVGSQNSAGVGGTTSVDQATSIGTSSTNIGINGAGTNIGVSAAATNISIAGSYTGLSATTASGSNAAVVNVQPTLCLNYIIKI